MSRNSLNPGLERGLDILELLSDKKSLTYSEIRDALQIPPSSFLRLMKTLKKRGYIRLDPLTRKYKLGPVVFSLNNTVIDDLELREEARPFLKRLVEQCGETVELVIMEDDQLLHIEKFENPDASVKILASVGERHNYMHANAAGKAFLAWMPDKEVERIIKRRGMPRKTRYTITSLSKLKEELKITRMRGYACDIEENRKGVWRFAAPVFDHKGSVVAVVTIAGPAFPLSKERKEKLAFLVMQTARDISEHMGYINR